jgi:hypothetical protein
MSPTIHNDTGDEALFILLLEAEVAALRSVLSEFGGDKQEYLQMLKANDAARMREHLRRPV